MIINSNGKTYNVKENKQSFRIEYKCGNLELAFKIPKCEVENEGGIEKYINSHIIL